MKAHDIIESSSSSSSNTIHDVCVLVLGDIGRSPRMQYHILSLLNNKVDDVGFNVSVVAYKGEKCRKDIEESEKIRKYWIDVQAIDKIPV